MRRVVMGTLCEYFAVGFLALTAAGCGQPEGAGSVSILKAKEVAAEKGLKTGASGDEKQTKKRSAKPPTSAAPKASR